MRQGFYTECITDESRLVKIVKRVKVENFAASNMKKGKPSREKKALGRLQVSVVHLDTCCQRQVLIYIMCCVFL